MVFAPFERASRNDHPGGLGLGLHVAKAIVEAHGGSIEATSGPGAGTTMSAKLPIEVESARVVVDHASNRAGRGERELPCSRHGEPGRALGVVRGDARDGVRQRACAERQDAAAGPGRGRRQTRRQPRRSPPPRPAPTRPSRARRHGLPVVSEGSGALTDVDGLPLLQLDGWSHHASSYDRSGGNTDWENGLGVDAAGDEILLDERGPGCVYRIWFTGFAASDRIHVYFDDEPIPRIEMALATFFGGQTAPFTTPLVGNGQDSSGGFFSYVPLPFAKSLRITATAGSAYYYNIDLHSLAARCDDDFVDRRGGPVLPRRRVWASAGVDPKPSDGRHDERPDVRPGPRLASRALRR